MHRLTEFSLRRPWLTLAILLAITVGLGLGVPKVKPAFGFRVLIGEDHPTIRDLDSMVAEFSGGLPIQIAWECGAGQPCDSVFDPNSLAMAAQLTQELEALPWVRAIEGPPTSALLVPSSEGFAVRNLVENGEIAPDSEILSQWAMEDRLWRNTLVSPDGRVGVILLQPIDNYPETDLAVVSAVQKALAEKESQGFTFHLLGQAPANVIGGRALAQSTGSLTPVLILLIGVVLLALVRSWQQALITLGSTGLALLWTLGLLGWLAWPQDGMLQVLAPLILIVGVCDAMHLLAHYATERRAKPELAVSTALSNAARDTGPACLITTLTTAAAFLSFTASDLDTFVRFGFISSFGVIACLALSFTLLPALLQWLPADAQRVEQATATWQALMDAVVGTTIKRAAPLLAASAALLLLFGWGWSHLHVDQNWLESYGEDSEFVKSVRFMEERFGLSQTLELDISLPTNVNLEDPATLQKIDAISQSLVEMPEFTQATSALTLIKRVNRLLHDNDPAYERIGDSRAANAELLEMIAFDDPETLGRWLSLDRSRFRISFDAQQRPQTMLSEILDRVNHSATKFAGPGWRIVPSGELAINHDWVRDVQATQLRSFPIAFGIVFILVSVFLRSWKLGLAAMVPTLLPVVVVLGAMGWIGMSLDVARAMLAAVVIGIGVDDAIHLLAHYKVRREEGDDPHAAIAAALQHTGRAIVTTSVALALGFLTLMMSAWQTVASFGLFVAIAIIGALVATLFVLPALIFAFAPKETKASSSSLSSLSSSTPSGPRVLAPAPALEGKD